jgi:hypothetical protein
MTIFAALQNGAPWTNPEDPDFEYRGRELARQKAFLVVSDDLVPRLDREPSVMPRYSYPGFQHGSMRAYRDVRAVPELHTMVGTLQERLCYFGLPVKTNHLILTRYRGVEDNIGFHNDKMNDIQRGTPIVSLSLGETREFHFGQPDPANPKMQTITTHRFILRSGDLFILGPQTNAAYRHAIVRVEHEELTERAAGAEGKPRISVVLRDIATMITREEAQKMAAKTVVNRRNKAKVAKPKVVKSAGKAGGQGDQDRRQEDQDQDGRRPPPPKQPVQEVRVLNSGHHFQFFFQSFRLLRSHE